MQTYRERDEVPVSWLTVRTHPSFCRGSGREEPAVQENAYRRASEEKKLLSP
jgi:hypothetical protein